ncbi:hypothetical protein PISL3812_00180 [Talaromyces islandicus]|uniref:SGNH hydrolase-type esterase domain-containing protein n=1 Tax=Talaromyces islandicus TaxID=28573 RepID=A0A0U1LIJ2_TALIS|nr:hypothetical protein PISL3812_00180 [Talaromyces islandicus]
MLDILCFGNSLTQGFWHYGLEEPHPYALALKETLVEDEVVEGEIEIDVEGKPGDLVNLEGEKTYDWVIVLGGTNDLGYGSFSPEAIFAGLQRTWSLALASSPTTKVLALTVPECAYNSTKLKRNRDALNKSILEHEEDRFFTFDLKSALPYHAMDDVLKTKIWDDGLHLTDKGYDMMGQLIAKRLAELLQGSKTS